MVPSQFRMIPVLDLKAGQAVHAVGGIRSHYRPVRSCLHPSSDPLLLARAYRERLGVSDLYLADLDAIAGEPPDRPLYSQLVADGSRLWIDSGLKDEADLEAVSGFDSAIVVVGLETVAGPEALSAILGRTDPDRVVLSLDLFQGRPRVPANAAWEARDAEGVSRQALKLGVQKLLLLDLARVGTNQGPGTGDLLRRLRASAPQVEFSVGGGISGLVDVVTLQEAGAGAVLVGTALHDGRIGRRDLDQLPRHSTSAD